MAIKTVSVDAQQVDGFKVETRTRQHIAYIDQPVASGGTDSGPTPLEYQLISLAGCMVSIGHIIARQRRLVIRKLETHVEGDLNPDVFMGKNAEERAGFSNIRVYLKVDGDMSQEEKEQFLHDIDARCPISDNLNKLTPIEFVVE